MQELTKQEQESLQEATLVKEWLQHRAWLEVIRPYLESKIRNSWVDPRKVTDKEAFFHEYVVAWGWSHTSDEFLKLLDEYLNKFEYLSKKKEGKLENNFKIGA